MKKIYTIFLITLMLSGCGSSRTLKSLGWSAKSCPLERMEWMEVSAGYDTKTVLDLATKLEAAAQSDIKAIKGSGNANGDFTASLNKVINNAGEGKIKVSQDFYETYISKRSAICAIYQGIKDGLFKSDEAKLKASQAYLDLAVAFGEIKSAEEKKNQ